METPTRVMVVDDSAVVRRLVTEALAADPGIEVVATAPNGRIALAKLPQVVPDLVTLDVEMPELDGLATLRELRRTYRDLPVIMFSTLTERGATATLDALAAGATDYATKPSNVRDVHDAIRQVREDLIPRIRAICPPRRPAPPARTAAPAARPAAAAPPPRRRSTPTATPEILAIGTSTGGPNALTTVLSSLPADLGIPIVIVQHMPPVFTGMLADRLSRSSPFLVREGIEAAPIRPGEAWLAPGGRHMEVAATAAGAMIHLHDGPPERSCRPAVDVLFRSVSAVYGSRALAVVLTGMGEDGLRGVQQITEAGGHVVAQDEASSVVWGMPGAVIRAGLADRVVALDDVAQTIVNAVHRTPVVARTSGGRP